jgi:hypothetical protein
LQTRTKEGLELKISCAFQYQIVKEKLPDMYRLLQNDYEAVFTRIARNAILKISGDYEAPDYWKDRKKIGADMQNLLEQHMSTA